MRKWIDKKEDKEKSKDLHDRLLEWGHEVAERTRRFP